MILGQVFPDLRRGIMGKLVGDLLGKARRGGHHNARRTLERTKRLAALGTLVHVPGDLHLAVRGLIDFRDLPFGKPFLTPEHQARTVGVKPFKRFVGRQAPGLIERRQDALLRFQQATRLNRMSLPT